jgi:hypothetical protein
MVTSIDHLVAHFTKVIDKLPLTNIVSRDTAAILLFFGSFDIDSHDLSQQGAMDFLCKSQGYRKLVIDRKRIFRFRPKTNIRQEIAAEYSADNEYSA